MLKAATIQYSSECMRAQIIFLPHLRESAFKKCNPGRIWGEGEIKGKSCFFSGIHKMLSFGGGVGYFLSK